MPIETKYGEFTIQFDEFQEKWIGKLDDNVVAKSEKLSNLKKALDRQEKEEKTFPRVKIFSFEENWNERSWRFGEVTSIAEDGKPWVTWNDGKKSRQKIWLSTELFLDTPENASLRDQWNKIYEQKSSLEKQMESLAEAMQKFTVKTK